MRTTISILLVSVTISILSACSGPQDPKPAQTAQTTQDSAAQPKVAVAGSRLKQPAGTAQPDVRTGTSVQGAGGW